MIENRDGSFGDIMPSDELLKKIAGEGIGPEVKAIHFGEEDQLQKLKELGGKIQEAGKENLEMRLDAIERNVNRIMIHLGIDDKAKVLKI